MSTTPAPAPAVAQQPGALVFEGLRSADLATRLDNFSKLKLVADEIGPQSTRESLLPYLLEFSDDEEAIVLEILNQLSTFVPCLGGSAHIQSSYDLLETFMLHDDPQVRTRACDVFISYLPLLTSEQILSYVIPVLRHMVMCEWSLGRLSATALLPHIYPLVPPKMHTELCAIYSALAVDEHPAVRRATCQQFGLLATFALNDQKLARMLYHLVSHTSKDSLDNVRIACVDSAIIVADLLRHYGIQHKALVVIYQLMRDTSWRVRYITARRFPLLLSSLDANDLAYDECAENFAKLLTDFESEVRTAAASVIGRVCCLFGAERSIQFLVPLFKHIADDTHDNVRIALAKDLLFSCNVLPQYVIHDVVLTVFQQLLIDVRSEVKLNLINNIYLLKPHLEEKCLLNSLLPSIIELSQHHQWRTRLSITMQYVILAKQINQDIFVQNLLPITLCQLCDPVASVRYGALANFFKFTVVYGTQWCETHLIPRLRTLSRHTSFQHRSSAALALTGLIQLLPLHSLRHSVFPILESLMNDKVSNIQLLALRSIAIILSRILGFSPHEHVWLQEDKMFSFTADHTTLTSTETTYQGSAPSSLASTSPTSFGKHGDMALIIKVLLQNIKNAVYWDQTLQLLPSSVKDGKLKLNSTIKYKLPVDTSIVPNTQHTQQQQQLYNIAHSLESRPMPGNAELLITPRQQEPTITRTFEYTNHNQASNQASNQFPRLPSLRQYLADTTSDNIPNTKIVSDYYNKNKDSTNTTPVIQNIIDLLSPNSPLLPLLESIDLNEDVQQTILYSYQRQQQIQQQQQQQQQLGLPIKPPQTTFEDIMAQSTSQIAILNCPEGKPNATVTHSAQQNTDDEYITINNTDILSAVIKDTATSLRDYQKLINNYIYRTQKQRTILSQTLATIQTECKSLCDGDDIYSLVTSTNGELSEPQREILKESIAIKQSLLGTIPFHLLLSPQTSSSNFGNDADEDEDVDMSDIGKKDAPSSPKPTKTATAPAPLITQRHTTELHLFLLLKRLRNDYRRIVREQINTILVKMNAVDTPNIDALKELNHLQQLLTEQYRTDVQHDEYLFQTTPILYQLQHTKADMLVQLKQDDQMCRNSSEIQMFKRELFKHIDKYRNPKNLLGPNNKRLRGADELIVFAQQTYRLITQMQSPMVQDLINGTVQ